MSMSGTSFRHMLEDAKTSEPAEVDTSFLDEYRRTGTVPRGRQSNAVPQGRQDDAVPHRQAEEPEPEQDAVEPEISESEVADDPVLAQEPEADSLDRDDERERDDDTRRPDEPKPSSGGIRGGSGNSCAASGASAARSEQTDAMAPMAAPPATPPVCDESDLARQLDEVLDAEDAQRLDHDRVRDISANRKSDQRDAIQAAASGMKGGSGSAADSLPESGFRLLGAESQLMVRNLPFLLMEAMRDQLRTAAVRERGVSDSTAKAFSKRLSQPALVAAFLLAHFDVRIDTDQATRVAVELFRSQDPLLGSIVERMAVLEQLEDGRARQFERLQQELREVRDTAAVIEQAVAYSIADRTENFLRGSHNIHDAPIAHKDAIYVRDKVREETRKRAKFERDRDGRPIR